MKINFPSVLNVLQSLAEKFALPAVDQKAGADSDVQSHSADQHALEKELSPYEVNIHDFGAPRWLFRSHYRSIFPHMF